MPLLIGRFSDEIMSTRFLALSNVFILLLFLSSHLLADEEDFYAALLAGYADLDADGDVRDAPHIGIHAGYEINTFWAAELGFKMANTETRFGQDTQFSSWELQGLYHPVTIGQWRPYVTSTIERWGFDHIDSQETKLGLGVGSLYDINEKMALRFESVVSYSVDYQLWDNVMTVGLQWYPFKKSPSSNYPDQQEAIPTQEPEPRSESEPAPEPETLPEPEPEPETTPEPEPVVQEEAPEEHKVIKRFTLDIEFASNSSELDSKYHENILELAEFLKDNPQTQVIIECHSDSIGNASDNLRLSQKRAESVTQALETVYGLNPARLTAKGYGESRPITSNDTPEGRAKNRRIHAVITASEQEQYEGVGNE